MISDRSVSEGHTAHTENGTIRIDLKFGKPLPGTITCLLYFEFDKTVRTDFSCNVTTEF